MKVSELRRLLEKYDDDWIVKIDVPESDLLRPVAMVRKWGPVECEVVLYGDYDEVGEDR